LSEWISDRRGRNAIFSRFSHRLPVSLEDLEKLRSFTHVNSIFYPALNLHYKKLLDLWYEEEKAKLRGSIALKDPTSC